MIKCVWYGRAFSQRRNGGRTQRFCGTRCRRALDAGLRAWTLAELAPGGSLSTTSGLHRRQRVVRGALGHGWRWSDCRGRLDAQIGPFGIFGTTRA
jgi:hypothetical protein